MQNASRSRRDGKTSCTAMTRLTTALARTPTACAERARALSAGALESRHTSPPLLRYSRQPKHLPRHLEQLLDPLTPRPRQEIIDIGCRVRLGDGPSWALRGARYVRQSRVPGLPLPPQLHFSVDDIRQQL
eukprot:3933324-Rhodomonas_salina.2